MPNSRMNLNQHNPIFDGESHRGQSMEMSFISQQRAGSMYFPQTDNRMHPGYYGPQNPIDPDLTPNYASYSHPGSNTMDYRQGQHTGYPMLQHYSIYGRHSNMYEEVGQQITHAPMDQTMDRSEAGIRYAPGHQNGDEIKGKETSLTPKIILRVINVLLIGFNIAGDWMQYEQWTTPETDIQLEDGIPVNVKLFGDSSGLTVECVNETRGAMTALAVLNGFGTLMALIQVIDIIGETIKEYDNSKGFQILHGWIETILTLAFEEIPQAVVVFLLNNSCKYQVSISIITLVNMIIGMVKASTRMTTCKQKKGPCTLCEGGCFENCCEDCCMFQIDVPCACRTFICQPCASAGTDQCRTLEWDICPKRSCLSCSAYDEDPLFAKRLYKKLASLHGDLLGLFLVFFILAKCGVHFNILHFLIEHL